LPIIRHARRSIGLTSKRRRQGREVGRPVMIDVVRLQHHAGKLREQIILFVGGAV
jgi:hypothetical protein